MSILVTGGLGYIGSHMVWMLVDSGYDPAEIVVYDNGYGVRHPIPAVRVIKGDVRSKLDMIDVLKGCKITEVMHFAGLIKADESLLAPLEYYHTNVHGTALLLEAMYQTGVYNLVFSSSAAVYGNPQETPVTITCPPHPINPYGQNKWMAEQLIAAMAHAWPILRYANLRYFNVAGADPRGRTGQCGVGVRSLPAMVLRAAKTKTPFTVNGTDYPTRDGSCVRDFVHVWDLCRAHLAALQRVRSGKSGTFNLGSGTGYSVMETVGVAKKVTGVDFPVEFGERRAGDPAEVITSTYLTKKALGWKADNGLEAMLRSAWEWERDR